MYKHAHMLKAGVAQWPGSPVTGSTLGSLLIAKALRNNNNNKKNPRSIDNPTVNSLYFKGGVHQVRQATMSPSCLPGVWVVRAGRRCSRTLHAVATGKTKTHLPVCASWPVRSAPGDNGSSFSGNPRSACNKWQEQKNKTKKQDKSNSERSSFSCECL